MPLAWGGVGAVLVLLAIREHPSTAAELANPGPGQSREPDGTVPADEAETVSQAISRVEQAAQKAIATVQQALAGAARKPPLWKRILTPLVLGVVGAVLVLLFFREYPRPPAPLENPGPALLIITTAATVTGVHYAVDASGVHVAVYAKLPRRPRASASEAVVEVAPPDQPITPAAAGWIKTVRFAPFVAGFEAGVNFSMSPYESGMAYNGLTASASFPEVIISAPSANPVLEVNYYIPSGSSYDWLPSPPLESLADTLVWDIHLTSADTAGQTMVGTNYIGENSDSNRTFIAGALIALALTAFLSAFQEALSRFAR